MPHHLRMELTLPSGHKETIEGDVPDAEWAVLMGFRDEAIDRHYDPETIGELVDDENE